jgi:hypothetical protein
VANFSHSNHLAIGVPNGFKRRTRSDRNYVGKLVVIDATTGSIVKNGFTCNEPDNTIYSPNGAEI